MCVVGQDEATPTGQGRLICSAPAPPSNDCGAVQKRSRGYPSFNKIPPSLKQLEGIFGVYLLLRSNILHAVIAGTFANNTSEPNT